MTSTIDNFNGYITLPVTTDPDTLFQQAVANIAATLPGWIPHESHIEVLLLEQMAAMCAESANVAAQVPLSIFSYFGGLIGILPNQGIPATALTTWTMINNQGYVVPANTQVGYQVLGNQLYVFSTETAFTVPSGSTQAFNVPIVASSVGTSFNGLATQTLTLINPALAFVQSIASTTISSGGEDAETTVQYLNRLSNELQLLTPRPILPQDFALLAETVLGVYRAAAFNNLNPFANNLVAQDATFSGGLGTWVAVSGCTVSNVTGPSGEQAMQIAATGVGDAVVSTGAYLIPQNSVVQAVVSLDYVSVARGAIVSVVCLDVNNSVLSTTTGIQVTEVTAAGPMVFALVNLTTPANTVNVKVQVTILSPAAAEHHFVAFPALFQLDAAQTNFVPDSSMNNIGTALSWVLTAGMVQTIVATGQYGLVYTGTGAASGAKTGFSEWFILPAGTYYASAYIDATNVTVGSPHCVFTGTGLTLSQTAGVASTLFGIFVLGSPTMVNVEFLTNNCTVQSGLTLTFSSPFIKTGSTPASYVVGPAWGAAGQIYNNERMVTVAAVDASGLALNPVIEAAISSFLESEREINFIVNVIGPSYTTIDVTWAGFVTTADPGATQIAANNALNAYLSPANWAGGNLVPPTWDSTQTTVRYLEVATVLGETPGLTLTSLTIAYHGGTQDDADLDLEGFAPLPQAGTIIGNVTQQ